MKVELLEDRLAPAVQAVSLADPSLFSDTAGGSSSVNRSSVSDDGRYVAFASDATNLVAGQTDTNNRADVFLYDRTTGTTTLVSRTSATTTGNEQSDRPVLSADGRYVAFISLATNLVAGQIDTNNATDVFVYDRVAGTTTLASRNNASATTTGNFIASFDSSSVLSADGRYVTFGSAATNLVVGQTDTNNAFDAFVFDRVAGTTTLVSRNNASATTTGNSDSGNPVLSADGRYVAFISSATNLVAGQIDTNNTADVFVYDRVAGTTTLASRNNVSASTTGNSYSISPVLSADGRTVAFFSLATNLVAGQIDTNLREDVFVYDQVAGTTTLASRNNASASTTGNSASYIPVLSADGRTVAFVSLATNLVAGQNDTNLREDVFVFDRVAGTTTLASRNNVAATATGDNFSVNPVLSADGRSVAFQSLATNLVAGQTDTNNATDVFVYDRVAGTTTLVSRTPTSATTTGNAHSERPVLSADGRYVAFTSHANNLAAGDFNEFTDVFLFDRQTSSNVTVSRRDTSSPSLTAGSTSTDPSISADGRYVAFHSRATNLVAGQNDTNNRDDVFVYDRATRTTTLVSRNNAAATATGNNYSINPVFSADGRYVAFQSRATNLVAGQNDTNDSDDVFVYDRTTGTTTLVSRNNVAAATTGNSGSVRPVLSADGRYVAFSSAASNLVAGQTDTNNREDVFVYDRTTGTTTLVSRNNVAATATGNSSSFSPVLSSDGRYVAFVSHATNLVAGQNDTNNGDDVFVFDRTTGTTTLVSRNNTAATVTGNDLSFSPVLSADGRYVAFTSRAANLVAGQNDTNNGDDVFVFDRTTGTTTLVSRNNAAAAATGNSNSSQPVLSADGRSVAFQSLATNLVAGQTEANSRDDVFVYDRVAGTTTLVSRNNVAATTTGNSFSVGPVLSADGRYVAFVSHATNLVAGQTDTNFREDVFVYDRTTGTTTLASHNNAAATTTGNSNSSGPLLSADGRSVAFSSNASNLVAGDFNGTQDVFLFSANRPPTDLTLSGGSVAEGQPAGAHVGALSTTDPDAGDTHTYTLVNNPGFHFNLAGNRLITSGMPLNFEANPSPVLRVRTTDAGGLSYEEDVTITVVNLVELFTWTGAGADANWTTGGNWRGGFAPTLADHLDFPAGAQNLTNTNTFAANRAFGSITLSGSGYTLNGNAVTLGDRLLDISAAGAQNRVNLALGGAGGLQKNGTGELVLAGANTYTGATLVSAGVLAVQNAAALGATTAGVTVNTGAALELRGGITVNAEPLTLAGMLRSTGSGGTVVNAWNGPITLAAAATVRNTGVNVFLTLDGAIATAGHGLTLDTVTGGGYDITVGGVISGAGGVTKTGPSGVRFRGANTYTGVTTISQGAILVENQGTLGAISSNTVVATDGLLWLANVTSSEPIALAGTLTSSGTATLFGRVTLTAGGATISARCCPATFTLGGGIGEAGASFGLRLFVDTNALLVLAASSTYTGATELIGGGTLRLAAANALPDAGTVTVNGTTTLDLNGQTEVIGALAGNGLVALGSGSLTAGGNNASTDFSGVISGTGGLTKVGVGRLTLSGPNNYAGTTAVNGGILAIQNAGLASAGGTTTVAAGVFLVFRDSTRTLTAASRLTGAGTVIFSFGNTTVSGEYNVGATSVTGGAVSFTASATTGTFSNAGGAVTVTSSGTLTSGGEYRQTAGSTAVTGGGLVTFGDVAVQFGTLAVSGGGYVFGVTAVRNAGAVTISDFAAVYSYGSYVQTAGSTVLADGILAVPLVDLRGGTLSGSGYANGDVANAATIVIGGVGAADFLSIGGNYTQSAAGRLTVVASGSLSVAGNYTQTAGATSVAGALGVNGTLTVQAGTLAVSGGGYVLGGMSVVNAGTLTVSGFAAVYTYGTYIQTAGSTVLDNGILGVNVVDLRGGTLSGSGYVYGNVVNAALVEIGGVGATGFLYITGNYRQTAAGRLRQEMSSRDVYDSLYAEGVVELGGTLDVAFLGGYRPNSGDLFGLLYGVGGLLGDFATVRGLDLGGGLVLSPVRDGFSYSLRATQS